MNICLPSPKQRLSWQLAEARINAWEGSVRSGKTTASLLAWCEFVRAAADGNLAMVGRTERTLKRNIVDVLVEMFGRNRARHVEGAGELWLFGRRIYLYGANNEEARTKIQGTTLVGAYVDEATTLPESFCTMLLSRLSLPGARLFATMNPDSPMHWLKRGYLDRARIHLTAACEVARRDEDSLDLARFSFRLPDNLTLPASYIAALEQEYTGLWHKRLIDGEWVAAEGAIYDMADVGDGGRHVCRKLPHLEHLTLGIDYGTANPFCALLIGIGADEGQRQRLYVAREWRWDSRARHRQLTDPEYSRRLGDWLAGGADGFAREEGVAVESVVIDPSASSMRLQLQRDGWGWAAKADNAVVDGIRDTASLFSADRLRIHESCSELRREITGYVWDPAKAAKGEDAPLKVDDHGPDALRYGVRFLRRDWKHWLIGLADDDEEKEAA